MIVTEEEAKTKRCQETYGYGFVSDNPAAMCIGPGCMAWRWVLPGHGLNRAPNPAFEADQGCHGYCGKAGKP